MNPPAKRQRTWVIRTLAGRCVGCGRDPHTGTSCAGLDAEQVIARARRAGAVYTGEGSRAYAWNHARDR